jgi:hypothetical protein
LVWDEVEKAYYSFFLSCDGKRKKNIWMTEPESDLQKVIFKRAEKKRKERVEKQENEENCHDNQQKAKEEGFCCYQHAAEMKKESVEKKEQKASKKLKLTIDGPDHCIHCDEDPCVFIQIEARLNENDEIYFDGYDYKKDPSKCNSGRRKRAFQYAAFIMWEGINYRKPHFSCVEDGVRALFPPFDGKTMGYKEK